MQDKVVHRELSYKITGLLFKVHTELGHYRNEKQYADYFEKLLQLYNIEYVREYRFLDQQYGKEQVRCVADFIINDKVLLEFKSRNFLTKDDYYQVRRYLITLNLQLGILINFKQYRLSPKRILNSDFLRNKF
ncbi:MAG: GxxExxY protein [Patescibacteria group bacterium]|jgi:GxxExxY protein